MNKNDIVMWSFMLLVLIALIYASVAKAGSVRVSYTLPETREDGEPIRPSELDKVQILIAVTVDASDDQYEMILEPGEYEFRAQVVDNNGDKSAWADVIAITEDEPACTAYNMTFWNDPVHEYAIIKRKLMCATNGHLLEYEGYCDGI